MFRSNQHNTKDTVSIFSTLNSCHREFNHQSCWGCSNSHSSPCQTAQYLLENMHLSDVVLHKGALYTQMGSEQVLSLRDETWGEESSWGKAWFVQTACCMVFIIFMNTFQKSYRIWGGGGVMYLLCISSGLEIVLNYPIQCFSYIALSWNYSLLSMEPKALLSRFPERSSRYHGANRTFGSD